MEPYPDLSSMTEKERRAWWARKKARQKGYRLRRMLHGCLKGKVKKGDTL